MGAFLSYSIISGLIMLAMYLAYRLVLARDTQHGFNRSVLLCIYFVAFVLSPFVISSGDISSGDNARILAIEGIECMETDATPLSQPIWSTLLIWLFMVGMAVVTVKTVLTWVSLTNVIRKGKRIRRDGYTLVVTDNERFAPFSWMHYVVISRSDYTNNFSVIAAHELRHVTCRHWIDLLVAQIICIVNWFNPAAWLMRDELMLVHEYQADMSVLEHGYDVQKYQMLLIKKAVGAKFPSLANSLNHSKLKKRISMMYKEKSSAGRKFRALALVPMLALALTVAGVPAVRAAMSTISSSDVTAGMGSETLPVNETTVRKFKVVNISNDGNETTVTVRGEGFGPNLTISSGAEFTNNGTTHQAKSVDYKMTDGIADIQVTFPFSDELKDAVMILFINSEKVSFTLDGSESVTVGTATLPATNTDNAIKIEGKFSAISDDATFYFDGKEISKSEMKSLLTDNISSISVDKKANTVKITSKSNNGNMVSSTGNMKFYFDGKEISKEELNKLSADNIEYITVNRKNNAVIIRSKE